MDAPGSSPRFEAEPHCTVRSDAAGPAGERVARHRLSAPDGTGATVIELGAAVSEVLVPDRAGRPANVTLAHRAVDAYRANPGYLGAVVGRTAGRIGGARYELDGRTVRVPANEGPNHLHGGPEGWHARRWRTVARGAAATAAWVELALASPDGDQGHPGRAEVRVRYAWTVRHELRVRIAVRAAAPLAANPTHHASWNLAGEGHGSVHTHLLSVRSDALYALGPDLVASGDLLPVAGTPFDLRRARPIGDVAPEGHPQAALAGGLDHPYRLDGGVSDALRAVARLEDPSSGRTLTLWTGEPCLQAYAGTAFDGRLVGPSGRPYPRGAGVALEPQRAPLAADPDGWTLRAGEERRHETVFAFGTA